MFTRKIGNWNLCAAWTETYQETWGEDGPYTRRIPYLLVQAAHDKGEIYVCSLNLTTEKEAHQYLSQLPETFTPDDNWRFDRNSYGSEAYSNNWHEEEYKRMDEKPSKLPKSSKKSCQNPKPSDIKTMKCGGMVG